MHATFLPPYYCCCFHVSEDLGDGAPPQLPAGFLVVLDISALDPMYWTASTVDLTGLDGKGFGMKFDTDPGK